MGLLSELFGKIKQDIQIKPSITEISNCRSIQAIKNLSKQNMYALQTVVFPNSRKGAVTLEKIIHTCDSIITQDNFIADDCKKLIYSTETPRVFYERYDLLYEKYMDMRKYEPFVVIYGYQPSESLLYYQEAKKRYEKKMIDRCYNKALIKADSLKTDKGKKNQFMKSYNSLMEFKDSMNPDNLDYANRKFGNKL